MSAKEPKKKPSPKPRREKSEQKRSGGGRAWQTVAMPLLAVFTGLLVGAIVIVVTDAHVIAAYRNFFRDPLGAIGLTFQTILVAYGALFSGALGSPERIFLGFQQLFTTGQTEGLVRAFWPLSESLVAATPYMLAGLAVAIGFKAGLFNIGAEGQFLMGALGSAWIGYTFHLPWYLHLPLALLGGALAGALWAALPGYLKATTGAHEVVNTIMMNWISFRLSDWLLNGPMKATGYRPITPVIDDTATLPRFFPDPIRLNLGFIVALLAALLVYWLLFKTTFGFEVRAVGTNPDASKYAGMNVPRNIVLVMMLSGALAGLGGATQVLGVDHWVGQGFSAGYGFDSIAIALLGKSHPVGVVLSALLWGALRNGATKMQSMAGIPIDIISIIQGLVIVFIAAPVIIRWIYRIRTLETEKVVLTRGWGK